jgi:hypothetical protein
MLHATTCTRREILQSINSISLDIQNGSRDEIGVLGTSFVDMSQDLKSSYKKLEEYSNRYRALFEYSPTTIDGIVITHCFDHMQLDHEAVFLILRRALVSSFLSDSIDSLKTAPQVFCCDTYGSWGLRGPFQPDQLVDVTHVWEKKLASVHAHESQPLPFYLDMIERQCLDHGRAAGSQYAEAFLHVPLFGRTDDKLNLGQGVKMRFCDQ